eukprot:Mrub_00233.p1 GENE.Mrub_00233~~Mrub_00233.p1  ORF type:complete len:1316 (+),score=284.44 Mrub_00233:563-3949(+)
MVKKNFNEGVSKIELVENNYKKFEYSIKSVSQMDKVLNFLNSMSNNTNYLQKNHSNYLSESNYNRRSKNKNSGNISKSLKSTLTRLLSQKYISFNEHQQIMTMIDEENPALNTIINFFKLNKDEDELLSNIKIMLSQITSSHLYNSNARPISSNNQRNGDIYSKIQRPTTSKVQNRIFESDSDFDCEYNDNAAKKDQNRFFAIMDEIENRNLIDEGEKIGVLKTLILEENKNIFKVIENYAEGNYNLIELARKLELIAKQKLEFFNERPKTPNERKTELYHKLNGLFNDKYLSSTEINVLHRLIEEENEFVISAFDVYESDSNLKELVDTLKKIVNKAMSQKINQECNISRLVSKKEIDENTNAQNYNNYSNNNQFKDYNENKNDPNNVNLNTKSFNNNEKYSKNFSDDQLEDLNKKLKILEREKEIEKLENKLKNISYPENQQNHNINQIDYNKINEEASIRPTTSNNTKQSQPEPNFNQEAEKNTEQKNTEKKNTIESRNLTITSTDDNIIMPKEYIDFLTYLHDNQKMDLELIDLVKDDNTWKKFIVASIADNQLDNWELLSELEFYLFQKALQNLMAIETYSKTIEDSGLDTNSIINYMIQDYNENSELWTTAILSILKENNPESLWYVTHENIIKGRKIKNSIYINKNINKKQIKSVEKKERTKKVARGNEQTKELLEDEKINEEIQEIKNNNKDDKKKKKSTQKKTEDKNLNSKSKNDSKEKTHQEFLLDNLKKITSNNLDHWQETYLENIIKNKTEPHYKYLSESKIQLDKLALISYEKVEIFVDNYFNRYSYDMILDIIKYDHYAHNSIDKLVNHRNDFNIIKFLYEKLSENLDDIPTEDTDFYSMVSRQFNECTKDPSKDSDINKVITEAIELMSNKQEREYMNTLLANPTDYPQLIESCMAAYQKNFNIQDVLLILNLTYNVNCRKYSFVVINNEEEFDNTLDQLSTSEKILPEESKYIRIKYYTNCKQLKEYYMDFCRTADIDLFYNCLRKYIEKNNEDLQKIIKEYDCLKNDKVSTKKNTNWIFELEEFKYLELNMDPQTFSTLKRVVFEHCVEDIFMALIEVYRIDKDLDDFTEGIDILINKLEDKNAKYDNNYDFSTILKNINIYQQKFTNKNK